MTPSCYGQVEQESTPWHPADHYRFGPGHCILPCLAPDDSAWGVGLPDAAETESTVNRIGRTAYPFSWTANQSASGGNAAAWTAGQSDRITNADGGLHRYRGARQLGWRVLRGRHIRCHRSDLGPQEAGKSSRVQGSRRGRVAKGLMA